MANVGFREIVTDEAMFYCNELHKLYFRNDNINNLKKKNTHFRAPSIFILHFFSHDFPITSTKYFAPKYIFCRCTFANSGKNVKINFLLATTRFTTSRNLRIAKQLVLHVNFTMATVGGGGVGGSKRGEDSMWSTMMLAITGVPNGPVQF